MLLDIIPVNNDKVRNSPKKHGKANSVSPDATSDDDDWREVKRKSKEGKIRKESKAKAIEREELEFDFDEDLDQEVPAVRQNMFTTDWYVYPFHSKINRFGKTCGNKISFETVSCIFVHHCLYLIRGRKLEIVMG